MEWFEYEKIWKIEYLKEETLLFLEQKESYIVSQRLYFQKLKIFRKRNF